MIEVKNLVKRFGGFTALDNLSFNVEKGSVYGLVGPNGAGKSTVIRHLTGIYRQDSGEVLIDSQTVYENPGIKQRLAYIPDEIFFFLQATTRDMMHFYKGIYPRFDAKLYEKLGKVFEFDDKRPMRQLSKGMQKQSAFRLAVCMRPDILILDEPVDGLDPVMRRQVWSIIMNDVSDRGTTVLVSSHNLRELEDVCDHVGIMHNGRLLLQRSLSELQDNIAKVQLVLPEGNTLPEDFGAIHQSTSGRVLTLIMRGSNEYISEKVAALNPVFFDLVPLTLEEIFIYELGGVDYEVREILL
ncbi:MAG TPA: ABC transporter ATP-binding protein [Clostridiales bacterium]|jgi:ABC-2 type transport system ATP-binding protein|nr:ABC transporter ATP-binding protein [Clostridiales bacterium]